MLKFFEKDKVIVSIQGLVSNIYKYYYGGISLLDLLLHVTFRDLVRFDTLFHQKFDMQRRGFIEMKFLKTVKHVIGRTHYDKAICWAINPKLQYHYLNETLRECFYDKSWNYGNCIPYSIFISQSYYPIKGLHQFLKALKIVVKFYPNTMVYIAGYNFFENNIFRTNGYGYYIKKLIKKLGLFRHIKFLGSLGEVEMVNQFLSSNIVVNPSIIENNSNSVCEAQLLGVPCITYGQSVVLNYFFGTIVKAAQGITNQVSGQISSLSTVFIKAVNPLIDKSEGGNNRALMLNVVFVTTKTSFFLLIFIYIPFIIEMPYLLKLWLKEVPEYTVIFCRLLLIRNLIEQLGWPLILGVHAKGNIKGIQLSIFLVAFFPLLFAYVFFKIGFPPYSIYLIFIVYSLIVFIMTIYYAVKEFELPLLYFLKNIVLKSFVTILVFSITLVFTYLIIPQGLFRLVFKIALIFILYFPLIFILGMNDLEKSLIRKMIYSFKKIKF